MEYNFKKIEKKWQDYWEKNETYKVLEDLDKEKYYVLDMFPYPSGAGLHVGHPLGYIASDIYARYKKSKGFNLVATFKIMFIYLGNEGFGQELDR